MAVSVNETCSPNGNYAQTNYAKTVCSAKDAGLLNNDIDANGYYFYPEKGCVYSNSTWDNNLGSRRHVVDASDFERMYAGKIASSEYNRGQRCRRTRISFDWNRSGDTKISDLWLRKGCLPSDFGRM